MPTDPSPPASIKRYRTKNTITSGGHEYVQSGAVLHTLRECPNLSRCASPETLTPGEPNPRESYSKERYREQFGDFEVRECSWCRKRRTGEGA